MHTCTIGNLVDHSRPQHDLGQGPPAHLRWVVRIIAVSALAIAGHLAWVAMLTGNTVGCGSEGLFDCGEVLSSRWSKWMGLPVSLPAAAWYASLVVTTAFVGPRVPQRVRQTAWLLSTVMMLTAGLSAMWFIGLQAFVVGKFCVYCLFVHAAGLVLAALALCYGAATWAGRLQRGALAMLGASVLILGQVLVAPPPTYVVDAYDNEYMESNGDPLVLDLVDTVPPSSGADAGLTTTNVPTVDPEVEAATATTPIPSLSPVPGESNADDAQPDASAEKSKTTPTAPAAVDTPATAGGDSKTTGTKTAEKPRERIVSFLGGRAKLDAYQRPVIGSMDAPHILVELFDYTCPHCRRLHGQLQSAHKRYGDQVAIVLLHLPLDARCNRSIGQTNAQHAQACDLTRCAIAVWRSQPAVFEQYHDWMFASPSARSASEARAEAARLIGADVLKKALDEPVIGKLISQHVSVYEQAQKGAIPKLMFPRVTLRGEPNTEADLFRLLEKELKIEPVTAKVSQSR